MSASSVELRWQQGTLCISGDLGGDRAAALVEQLRVLPLPDTPDLVLDLGELDFDDGVAVAESVNALRVLLGRGRRLTLVEAPQMLAHTLYKVSMLATAPITLVDPREDEGTTAN